MSHHASGRWREWAVLDTQRTSWVKTKTSHHDPWRRRFSASQVRWRARGFCASRFTWKFELLERGREWTVLNLQITSWVQTKTAHHDPWRRRFSATQVALTRPRLFRFALRFTISSFFPTLGPYEKNLFHHPSSNRGDGVRVILHYFYSVRPSIHLRALFLKLGEAIETDTFVQERAPGTSIKLQNSHFAILPWVGFRRSQWRFAARWPMKSAARSLLATEWAVLWPPGYV